MSPTQELLPVFLPAHDVLLMREICEAAGIEGGGDGFAQAVLGDMINASLLSTPSFTRGLPEFIPDAFDLDPDRNAAEAMQAVVSRWNARIGGAA